MRDYLQKDFLLQISLGFFIIISVWWVILFLSGVKEGNANYLFGASYGLICILGGLAGLFIVAPRWGGFGSLMGQAIVVLSLGLLTQEFGQLVFSYYNIFLKVPVPYPSIADFGFFGTIPFYIYGIFLISKLAGVKFSLKKFQYQILALVIPLGMLVGTYAVFLRGYEFDFNDPIKIFLDFGYPFGEAVYISIAILAFSLTRNVLGGLMKGKIMLLIIAFVLQYVAEFNFLWQSYNETWLNGGYGDYLYFLAYFTMTVGIIQLKSVADDLKKG